MKRETWIGPPVSGQKRPCRSREDSRLRTPVMANRVLIADFTVLNRCISLNTDEFSSFMGKIKAILH